MDQQHQYPYQPHVHQEGKTYQENGKSMMKNILIIVSLLVQEHVRQHPTQMLPELDDVEHFHGQGGFC